MEDKLLIEGLVERKEESFSALVLQYQRRVYNTVLSISQQTEEAEDLAQEVFMEIFESIHKYRGESSLSTWIYRIATNKALEFIRKKKAQKRFAFVKSLFGQNDEIVHQSIDFEHPGILLENKERAKVLFSKIEQLAENQKVAYCLHNLEGLSYEEIAGVMKLSKSSVESLIFRAKQNLRKSLEHFYKNEYDR